MRSILRRLSAIALVTGMLAAGVFVPAASAVTTRTVNCDSGGDLQAALSASSPGDIVKVSGTCYGNFIAGAVTIKGNPKATLDGMSAGRTLAVFGNIHLSDLTVTGGADPSGTGGGIAVLGSAFLNNVTVTGNEVTRTDSGDFIGYGGGVVTFGDLHLTSSRVTNNRLSVLGDGAGNSAEAIGGGAVAFGSATVTGSTIQGNVATSSQSSGEPIAEGGGIAVGSGNLTITNSKIVGNRVGASGDGGRAYAAAAWDAADDNTKHLKITKSVISGNQAGATTDTANTPFAGFSVMSGPITGGTQGNPINVSASNITGNKNIANGDSAVAAGAVASLDAGVAFTNSLLQGNVARVTGPDNLATEFTGVLADANLTLTNTRVLGNRGSATASNGTAASVYVLLAGGDIAMTKSTVDGNTLTATATNDAAQAAFDVVGGGFTMTRSTISRNTLTAKTTTADTALSAFGGVVADHGTISNSTIALNSMKATSNGAAAQSSFGALVLSNSVVSSLTEDTIAKNTVAASGSTTIKSFAGVVAGNMTTVRNSIIAKNGPGTSPDCSGPPTSGDYNLIGSTSGCGWVNGGHDKLNKNSTVRLGALGNFGGPTQTMMIAANSAATDAAPNAHCPIKSDQRNVHRPQHVKCDIGALERTSTDPTARASSSRATASRQSESSASGLSASALRSRILRSINVFGFRQFRSDGPSPFSRAAISALKARAFGAT